LLAGITSCSSTYIVLYLSAAENASVLFPIVSIAQMIAVWGIGVLCFKEKLKLLQTIGLVIGIASIVLLKI
jgi:multidrug transporter EmrE-like cation transporter